MNERLRTIVVLCGLAFLGSGGCTKHGPPAGDFTHTSAYIRNNPEAIGAPAQTWEAATAAT